MTTSGRPSWLDRAVDEALAAVPTAVALEVRVMLIAAAPTIQNAAGLAVLAQHHVTALREAADSIDDANGRTEDGFDIAHASSWLRARADEIDPEMPA